MGAGSLDCLQQSRVGSGDTLTPPPFRAAGIQSVTSEPYLKDRVNTAASEQQGGKRSDGSGLYEVLRIVTNDV